MLCYDVTNRLSDISFGDAWKLGSDPAGLSIVVSRSDFGETILQQANLKKRILLRKIDPFDVIRSQELEKRLTRFYARSYVWTKFFWRTGKRGCTDLPRPALLDLIYGLVYCLSVDLSQKEILRKLILNSTFLSRIAAPIVKVD
jgi:hypothetical protein